MAVTGLAWWNHSHEHYRLVLILLYELMQFEITMDIGTVT